jgi:hypothetical protein
MEANYISLTDQLSHFESYAQETIKSTEQVIMENHIDRRKHVSILKDLLVAQAIIARARRTLNG